MVPEFTARISRFVSIPIRFRYARQALSQTTNLSVQVRKTSNGEWMDLSISHVQNQYLGGAFDPYPPLALNLAPRGGIRNELPL